jgi:hypothetical protein
VSNTRNGIATTYAPVRVTTGAIGAFLARQDPFPRHLLRYASVFCPITEKSSRHRKKGGAKRRYGKDFGNLGEFWVAAYAGAYF